MSLHPDAEMMLVRFSNAMTTLREERWAEYQQARGTWAEPSAHLAWALADARAAALETLARLMVVKEPTT